MTEDPLPEALDAAQCAPSAPGPEPRTLVDILYDTARRHPHAPAIDDGEVQLTYAELIADIEETVDWLAARGIGRGDRIGIRIPGGGYALYVAILAVLAAGAAYVPIEPGDDERAGALFGELGVVGVITERGLIRGPGSSRGWRAGQPLGRDDAWILVPPEAAGAAHAIAVTHRIAAAAVDAQSRIFLTDSPIGPGDRVLAAMPVATDAACREMWLAWAHGACLVPAPPALARNGVDLGPWLSSRTPTVVTATPSAAARWPVEALESVRLLILVGETCPADVAARLVTAPLVGAPGAREVWSCYGAFGATGTVCAARLGEADPTALGSPLPGWEVAVVDEHGRPVGAGEVGELVLGGGCLARAVDPALDGELFPPIPALGWNRACRTGDQARADSDGVHLIDGANPTEPMPALDPRAELTGTAGWLAEQWRAVLGAAVDGPDADFFVLGGGPSAAARLVSALRSRYPQLTVADVYDRPRLGALAEFLDGLPETAAPAPREVRPTPRFSRAVQSVLALIPATLTGLPWAVWLGAANNVAAELNWVPWTRTVSWWWILFGFLLFVTPLGRLGWSALSARLLLSGLQPGVYRRGGAVHLRVWLAERIADAAGARSVVGTPWLTIYARALGNKIGKRVDLHTVPPVTGMLTLGDRCAIDPEVDLRGHWVDGDAFHVGRITVAADAAVGTRSVLLPGTAVGVHAVLAPGSCTTGRIGDGQFWAGSPAVRSAPPRRQRPSSSPPPNRSPLWGGVYAVSALLPAALPLPALAAGALVLGWAVRDTATLSAALAPAAIWTPVAAVVALITYAVTIVAGVRLLSLGLRPGRHPVRSRAGWQAWLVARLTEAARAVPVSGALLAPVWSRLLGAEVGRGAEICTVPALPRLTTVGAGTVLGRDAAVGGYALGGGWLRLGPTRIGDRAVVGDAALVPAGADVPDNTVISAAAVAPNQARPGSAWLGSPATRWRAGSPSAGRRGPQLLRAIVETARLVPVVVTVALGVALLAALQWTALTVGWYWAVVGSGIAMLVAAAVAGGVVVLTKWLVAGRIRAGQRSPVARWRQDLAATFAETVAAPWFCRLATGSAAMTLWLRALGAAVGRGVWCETTGVSAPDLVRLGAGAAVNRAARIPAGMPDDGADGVVLEAGSTIGPHSAVSAGARIGAGATVGPASLVLGGDELPASTRWLGNPIAPWPVGRRRPDGAQRRARQTEKPAA